MKFCANAFICRGNKDTRTKQLQAKKDISPEEFIKIKI